MNSRTVAHNLFALSKKGVSTDLFANLFARYTAIDPRFCENVIRDLEYLVAQEESINAVRIYSSDTQSLEKIPEFALQYETIEDPSLVYGYRIRDKGQERDASFVSNIKRFRNHLKK